MCRCNVCLPSLHVCLSHYPRFPRKSAMSFQRTAEGITEGDHRHHFLTKCYSSAIRPSYTTTSSTEKTRGRFDLFPCALLDSASEFESPETIFWKSGTPQKTDPVLRTNTRVSVTTRGLRVIPWLSSFTSWFLGNEKYYARKGCEIVWLNYNKKYAWKYTHKYS